MEKTYGYCRVSTHKQDLERQERGILNAAPDALIVREEHTGTEISRPVFDKLLARVKPGDTIIFDSVSRMSRNAADGIALYQKLYADGINLRFLNEPYIDTDTYRTAVKTVDMTGTDIDCIIDGINKYLFILARKQIEIAFIQAETENNDRRRNIRQGIETARTKGAKIGQRQGAKLTVTKAEKIKEIIAARCRDFDGTDTDADTMVYLAGASIEIPVITYAKNPKPGEPNRIETGKTRTISAKLARNTYYKYKAEIAAERETK